jgi:dihydroorotase
MRTVIKHGRIVDPANNLDKVADLFIENGKIVAIGKSPAGFTPDKVIEAKNRIVCPGLIDLSARLREPGHEHKATIASETAAAASGGITSICCPPDTSPVIDTSAIVELIHQRALLANKAKVYCLGALTSGLESQTLASMHTLKTAGCIGVSNAYASINDTAVLRRALEYAATCNLAVHLFCEDDGLRNDGIIHEGIMSVRLGLPGIPETAETISVSRVLLLIEQTATKIHFCRISSARSLSMIAQAKQQGLPVTADVDISHLYLTEIDLSGFNSLCYVRPPLRTTGDRDALRQALATGIIDAICSDHQPHDEDAKAAPFGLTEPGVSTLDVLLSLSLRLVQDKVLDLQSALAALTIKPAKIAGIDAGHLGKGGAADVCIIDPELVWIAEKETLASAGKNCPFLGWEMTGKVTHTLLDGKIIYENTNQIS